MDAIGELRKCVRSRLLTPGHREYDRARQVYNRTHDLHPLAIVRTLDRSELRDILSIVSRAGLELAVRGGGHHVAGFGGTEGGVLIDFSPFRSVEPRRDSGFVRVAPGARLGDLDRTLCGAGFVVPTGTVSDTGIGGLALGGGIGWLVGPLGLTCDHIVGADVLLADGRIVRAEDEGHEDLLWALRGGGGNFGIVLEFRFKMHPLPPVACGSVVSGGLDVAGHLHRALDFLHGRCPSTLTVALALARSPSSGVSLSVDFCCVAVDARGAMQDVDALLGAPVAPITLIRDFPSWQRHFDHLYQPPMRGYWKSLFLESVDLTARGILLDAIAAAPGPRSSLLIEHLHGGYHAFGSDHGAFPARTANFNILISTRWQEPRADELHRDWVQRIAFALDPAGLAGAYSNYNQEDDARPRRSLARSERIQRTKRTYDPCNLFRRNHNVMPSDPPANRTPTG